MPAAPAPRHAFILIVIGLSLVLLGAWMAWILPQPACGPPGNTALGHANRWVPWAFVAAEGSSLLLAGLVLRRPLLTIAVTVLILGSATVFAGGLIAFLIAAHAGCFS